MYETSFGSFPLDPGRAVTWIVNEVDSASERDMSIRKAKALLEERIEPLSDADRGIFSSLIWMWLKPIIISPTVPVWPPPVLIGMPPGLRAIRVGLADGDAVLRTIEASLDTAFSADAIQRATRDGREAALADPRRTEQLNALENELHGGTDADVTGHAVPVLIGVGLGLLVGVAAAEVYYHHIAHDHH